jgi:hypothetical protein
MATSIPTPLDLGKTHDRAPASIREHAATISWLATSVVVAATAVVVGVIWDISWHMTIGRDSFWTPAHMAIYFGGLLGGLASGLVVLQTTFGQRTDWRESSVRLWGFRGPSGAWVSIWGAFAMLTSAPFDDWWHNAYGLDVQILSPPHMVLAAGMVALALGAMLVMLAAQNRHQAAHPGRWAYLFAWTAGCVLSFLALMVTEYSFRTMMHTSLFYQVACAAFPLLLVAAGNVARHRWGITLVALAYTLIRILMVWILPLFPAEPKLGPIHQDITHMVPMDFPLLLIVPALAMDLVRQRMGTDRLWRLVLIQGAVFWALFLAAQWPFADFLVSPASHNWFFATDNYPYDIPMTSNYVRGIFIRERGGTPALLTGLALALPFALLSAALGGLWSRWLRQVQR